MKAWFSIFLIVYPILQKVLALKGIELPDVGDVGGSVSQSVGVLGLAASDPIHKA